MKLSAYLPQNHVDALAMGFTFIMIPVAYFHGVLYIAPTIWPTDQPHLPLETTNQNAVSYYTAVVGMTFLFLNTMLNLVLTVTVDTSCGRIPLPVVSQPGWYFCPYCRYYAPPRAHHCPTCRRCVLRRDHHCFFAGKCIGYYNHRYFVAFLAYLLVSAILGLVTSIVAVYRLAGGFSITFIPGFIFPVLAWMFQIMPVSPFVMLMTSVALFVVMGAGGLLGLQLYIVSRGQTYYEMQKNINPYRKSVRENFADVLGKNWWFCWLCPLIPSPMVGDGAHYPPRDHKQQQQHLAEGKGLAPEGRGGTAASGFGPAGKRKTVKST